MPTKSPKAPELLVGQRTRVELLLVDVEKGEEGPPAPALEVLRTILVVKHNASDREPIRLKFIGGRKVMLRDLLSGEQAEVQVAEDGIVIFAIDKAPAFRFLRYELLKDEE